MRTRILMGIAVSLAVLPPLLAQTWKLPSDARVKDSGTRTYKFVVDYNTANTQGEIIHRDRVSGEYTRGLPEHQVLWKNVTVASAEGATAPFSPAQKRDFMEGFRYPDDLALVMKPEFFKTFPAAAVQERNLVWDTGMIEHFGQEYFEHLKLNEPYHPGINGDVNMPAIGTFHNRDVVLEWIGRSQRNGHDCALIKYQAFFNPVEIVNSGITLKGRSDYWGEIWVSLETRQIEYGILYENVIGELKLAGQEKPQILNVFRVGVFAPLK